MKPDQILRWLPFGIQIAAYLWLVWIIFFSGFDRRIPVPYMATHVVFGVHALIVLGVLGMRAFHGPTSVSTNWVLVAFLPILLTEIVLFLLR